MLERKVQKSIQELADRLMALSRKTDKILAQGINPDTAAYSLLSYKVLLKEWRALNGDVQNIKTLVEEKMLETEEKPPEDEWWDAGHLDTTFATLSVLTQDLVIASRYISSIEALIECIRMLSAAEKQGREIDVQARNEELQKKLSEFWEMSREGGQEKI